MRKYKAFLPVILWMTVIFIASTDLGSSRNTSRLVGPILRFFKADVTDETIRRVQVVLRKCGHITVYGVLAALTWRARKVSRGEQFLGGRWNTAETLGILVFCILYAISDELHQAFVKSRMGSAWDVGFDAIGALLALIIIRYFCARKNPHLAERT